MIVLEKFLIRILISRFRNVGSFDQRLENTTPPFKCSQYYDFAIIISQLPINRW